MTGREEAIEKSKYLDAVRNSKDNETSTSSHERQQLMDQENRSKSKYDSMSNSNCEKMYQRANDAVESCKNWSWKKSDSGGKNSAKYKRF